MSGEEAGASVLGFKISCGNWIYPSRDSRVKSNYDIDFPLVALVYPTKRDLEREISDRSGIEYHLHGPRYLSCEIISGRAVTDHALIVHVLKNHDEEDFEKPIGVEVQFDARTLCRSSELWSAGFENSFKNESRYRDSDWWSILFTSILLQAHTKGRPLPEGVTFRQATIPEIEQLGRW